MRGRWAVQYLNNMIEQDHRRIKQRIRPMLGFQRFESAAVTISASSLCRKFRSSSLRPVHWMAAQPQFRNFGGMPCWPPDPKFLETRGRIVHVQTLHQSPYSAPSITCAIKSNIRNRVIWPICRHSAGSTLILPAITVGKHRPPSVQINFDRSTPRHKTSPQSLSVLKFRIVSSPLLTSAVNAALQK